MGECWELWFIWQTQRERMQELEQWPWWRIAQAVDFILAEAKAQEEE
ncbi:MAG: hypothetical protein IGS03_00670 [Candidatus Sericytochromatia bacterium]|nr:hypothetical protein [Candidatus Sericytochromatia bacterium]